MKRRYWKVLLLPAVMFTLILCALNNPTTAEDQVAVIANTSNSVSTLSPGDLHRIFLGEKSTWPNGKHIFVVMAAPGSPERAVILKNVYKMSENEYTKYFMQASFTGAVAAPPKDADSAAQMKQLIAANPGAVGYIPQQDVNDSVKVLLKVP
jgi:ABC-type phosphate transport system substrate-binding protein